MSARNLLDQLLQQGQSLMRGGSGQSAPGQGAPGQQAGGLGGGGLADGLNSLLNSVGGNKSGGAGNGGGLSSMLSGFGGGALSGGAIGLLLGNKKVRKVGGKVALYGGMAALGVLAYRAYGNWQQQKADAPQGEPQTMDRLPAPEAERHSAAVLTAMIAAAKADGHIGPEERQLLDGELGKLANDASDRQWLEAELAKPLDPAVVAQAASSPEMAAEMYLASVLMVDDESYMERAYLDELARQLKLDPDLKVHLENQIRQETA